MANLCSFIRYHYNERDDRYLDLQPSSWDLLEQLRNMLHPLQVATTYLSSEFNVSVSAVLPVIHGIVNVMQPEDNDSTAIRNFKHVVTRELKKWWNLDEIDPSEPSVPLLATLLNPRFKDTKFLNCSQKSLLETSLIYLVNCHTTSHTTNSACEQARSKSHRSTALDMLLECFNLSLAFVLKELSRHASRDICRSQLEFSNYYPYTIC